ncbi:TadE/TadG family type IV pilus assembly protein [Nocardioides sp.]|uniref:TadE/TadG family type IV pilus assembly protein n=1 Tax=Nocardioides sp. TaxID=35761 RepID=UPI00262B3DB0|nr:TadE/TadG family type IV pilus assembly protein [Nocardioides sp.]MCW2738157.1 pilus assembly protein [Nocardioides sp.]
MGSSHNRRRRGGERGAVAVEFALLMPILLALVAGMIDAGFAINRYTMLNNAAREGVRAASLGQTSAEVTAVVNKYLGDSGVTATTVSLTCQKPNSTTPCASWTAGKASGGTAILTITYSHPWITPVPGLMGTDSINLSKTTRMRIE